MTASQRSIACGYLQGEVSIPASKSLTHRYYILAALSRKPVTIHEPLRSEDTEITRRSITASGYQLKNEKDRVIFTGNWSAPPAPVEYAVANAGTSARLLTAFAAVQPVVTVIDGSQRMRQRPMGYLIVALEKLGIKIEHRDGFLPITVHGRQIEHSRTEIDARMSSQFLSALLMIAPKCRHGLTIDHFGRIASRPYVDITLSLMKTAGIKVTSDENSYTIAGGQNIQLPDVRVEGDYSSASYFLCSAAITGGPVTLKNLRPDSVQGDRVILDLLSSAGAEINWHNQDVTVRGGRLTGIDRDMNDSPDLVPAIAVTALFADSPSRFRNVGHLRYKETDRLAAIIDNITLLGGKAYADGEDLVIEPQPLSGAVLPTYDDHRMAMAFSLAGLKIPGVIIDNPACVAKSYPEYWNHFDSLFHQ